MKTAKITVIDAIANATDYIYGHIEIPDDIDRDDLEQEIAMATIEVMRGACSQSAINSRVVQKIKAYIKNNSSEDFLSLDELLQSTEDDSIRCFEIPDIDAQLMKEALVRDILEAMLEKEREYSIRFFGFTSMGERETLKDIAASEGIHPNTVRQRINCGIRHGRHAAHHFTWLHYNWGI